MSSDAPRNPPRERSPGPERIGVFGGSFDPVHVGHLHVARSAQRAAELDRLIWVPAARPPHKPDRILAGADDRVRMLELAIALSPSWSISKLELERAGPSYTIDTLRELRDAAPGARFHLVLGGDNLDGFAKWREVRAILAIATPIVVVRRGDERELCARLARELGTEVGAQIERGLVTDEVVLVSSTALREALERGELAERELPAGVAEYIRARGIYRRRNSSP